MAIPRCRTLSPTRFAGLAKRRSICRNRLRPPTQKPWGYRGFRFSDACEIPYGESNRQRKPQAKHKSRMEVVFEELIRKFAEISNETAGEHFTPREVIRLMVSLLFIEDDEALTKPGVVRSMYDLTAGTSAA